MHATTTDLARSTPSTRDRYVDFLRIASIVVVVLGHWLMAVVTLDDGQFELDNVLGMVPLLWLATWLLQVMPVFFFVGGFANLVTIDGHRRKGMGTAEYLVGRAQRLVRPVAVLFAVWIPLAIALVTFGVDREVLGDATRVVCQPLWFVGVYLIVSALAPPMRDLHASHRARILAGLVVLAVMVDLARFAFDLPAVGWLNVVFVWLFAQQLGFFYADGALTRLSRARLTGIGVAALGALVALTTFGPYPSSMVGLSEDRISNMAPPTLCLVALTVLQVALVMLARPTLTRWLQHEKRWTAVVAGNGVIMTIFLWHLSAMLFAVVLLYPLGFPQPEGGTAAWWITRPLWIVCGLIPLAVLVACFGRFERPKPAPLRAKSSSSSWVAAVGTALLAIGISGIATGTLGDVLHGTSRLVLIDITPLQAMTIATAGWLLLRSSVTSQSVDVSPVTSVPLPGA
jgi:fucose 4-O-acetylase-like acetyltransferase